MNHTKVSFHSFFYIIVGTELITGGLIIGSIIRGASSATRVCIFFVGVQALPYHLSQVLELEFYIIINNLYHIAVVAEESISLLFCPLQPLHIWSML